MEIGNAWSGHTDRHAPRRRMVDEARNQSNSAVGRRGARLCANYIRSKLIVPTSREVAAAASTASSALSGSSSSV